MTASNNFAASVLGLVVWLAGPGSGSTWAVTNYVTAAGTGTGANWADATSLTNALQISRSNDVIWLAQGVYTNAGTFAVASNGVTLYGGFTTGMSDLTERDWTNYPAILDGKRQNAWVVTVSGAAVTLDGLVISNSYGSAAGGVRKPSAGALTLANCWIVGHDASPTSCYTIRGIGACFTNGSVLMTNCVVARNTNSGDSANGPNAWGFGVYSKGADLQIVDCSLSDNYGHAYNTRSAAGVGLWFDQGNLRVLRTVFTNNVAGANSFWQDGGGGSAVYLGRSTTFSAVFSNCTFQGNVGLAGSIAGAGAAVWARLDSARTAAFVNCSFAYNTNCNGDGGAFYLSSGTLELRNNSIIGNTCSGSGGGICAGGTLNMSNNVLIGGTARGGHGGGIYFSGTTLNLRNNTLTGNACSNGHGGGIYFSGTSLNIKNSILWTNRLLAAGYTGSEIYMNSGALDARYGLLTGTGPPHLYTLAGVASASLSCVMTNTPLFAGATDCHLSSPAGRWSEGSFIMADTAYSPCIDAGDPADPVGDEIAPNGARINLGAYGGTAQASKSPDAAPLAGNRPAVTNSFTRMNLSGELTNSAAVIAIAGICYGTNSISAETTNGWQYVTQFYPPWQTGSVFSLTTPFLVTNTTYYYRAYATNGYGVSWAPVASFTTDTNYPPGYGIGGGPDVIHVKLGAVGDADGRDWYNAYTLVGAATAAAGGSRTNIWIAGATYPVSLSILIASSARLLGGFAGTETNAADRDWRARPVILDGQAANQRVVTVTGPGVTLDGLVISNSYGDAAGGILKSSTGALTLANCRIVRHEGRTSFMKGIGGCFTNGSVLMTNCVVAKNTISGSDAMAGFGYGIYSKGADLRVVDCSLSDNYGHYYDTRAAAGVALWFDQGNLQVVRTDFTNNAAGANSYWVGGTGGGTAIYLGNNATLSAVFSNCVFFCNTAPTGSSALAIGQGAVVWAQLNSARTAAFVNCTFAYNTNCNGYGGAFYVSSGTILLRNSILWTNRASRAGYTVHEIYADGANSRVIGSFSDIAGTNEPYVLLTNSAAAQWGTGILTVDPLFAGPGDLHLKSKGGRWDPGAVTWVNDPVVSPCIDAGDTNDPVGGELPPNGHRINLGAYGGTWQASKTSGASGTVFVVW